MDWNQILTPYRFRLKDRNRTDIEEFQYDSSKIIFSSAFRRLQNKTQVFPLSNNDFVRTRLTHSLEVSNIAANIGRGVEKELIKKGIISLDKNGFISTILGGASLVHDIGNPPFGHYGETVIQNFFKKYFKKNFKANIDIYGNKWTDEEIGDFTYFEGNAQAFRLLKKNQYTRDEHSINLTFPVLATTMKYPRSSCEGNNGDLGVSYKKFGYFQSEKEPFFKIIESLGMIENGKIRRHPLVFLLEAADDIAYSVADIEDGCKKGLITLDILKKQMYKYLDKNNLEEKEILETLENINVDEKYPIPLEIIASIFRIKIQNYMMDATVKSFLKYHDDILSGHFDMELLDVSEAAGLKNAFKELGEILFNSREVLKLELAGDKIITILLEEFTNAITSERRKRKESKENKLYQLISSNYRFLKDKYPDSENILYNELRLITDFICGMTDSYALDLYRSISAIEI
ncbi:MAG: dNTP triphosphohydrolase [Fusobacteriaceae bacterium]|nr:dNTP triphosphohydrolase [Fusobacteriaceae bacterium]